jgi:hypothetical protein
MKGAPVTRRNTPPVEPPVPSQSHFYKYKAVDKHFDAMENLVLRHTLYFPRAKQLNDPREAKPVLAQLSEKEVATVLKKWFIKSRPPMRVDEQIYHVQTINQLAKKDHVTLFRQMTEELYKHFDQYRIFSLSKRWDNLNLWATYADCHRGYCLEFARIDLFEFAREVSYDVYDHVPLTDEEQWRLAWFYSKSPEWRCEEEVRIVLPNFFPGGQERVVSSDCLTRIILGKDISTENANRIIHWASNRTPTIDVVKTQFDIQSQKLTLVPVSKATPLS